MSEEYRPPASRRKAVYEIPCLCGANVVSETSSATCDKCGRLLQVDWTSTARPDPAATAIMQCPHCKAGENGKHKPFCPYSPQGGTRQ